jgi:hypothetical protein
MAAKDRSTTTEGAYIAVRGQIPEKGGCNFGIIKGLTVKALNAAGTDTPPGNATRSYGAAWKLSITKLPESTALPFMMEDVPVF